MRIIIICVLFTLIISCATGDQVTDTEIPEKDDKKITNNNTVSPIETGWTDNDTYTVVASANNINQAKANARKRILMDIVRARMMKQSRYTDITKINVEFETLFRKGEIIKQKEINEGIEIYYQIREKDLKFKFGRK